MGAHEWAFYVTPEAWDQLQRTVSRLRSQYSNLDRTRAAPRHASQNPLPFIEFQLLEELRRGDIKKARHLPWLGDTAMEDLEVIEKDKLSGGLKAPVGTTGFAIRTTLGWVIINLDCKELLPIDDDEEEES